MKKLLLAGLIASAISINAVAAEAEAAAVASAPVSVDAAMAEAEAEAVAEAEAANATEAPAKAAKARGKRKEKPIIGPVVDRPDDGLPIVIRGGGNMRDLGGWTGAGGLKVRRGLMYRSVAPNKLDHKEVVDGVTNRIYKTSEKQKAICLGLKIKTDLDLRFDNEVIGMTGSPLGESVEWVHVSLLPYKVYEKPSRDGHPYCYRRALDVIFNPDKQPVLIHCAIGADRTGCICALALGILGVSENDIRRDYTRTPWLRNGSEKFEGFVKELRKKYPAETLGESMVRYAKEALGYTDEDIAAIRARMLEKQ